MKRNVLLSILLLTLVIATASAQIDYSKQYFNAKILLREGKNNLAMETFKPLIAHDAKNRFSEYASFYYALAAYKQGFSSVAKDMFIQTKKLYPTWDKVEEVDFWLGKIYLDNKDYFQGIKVWNSIKNKGLQKDIEALKAQAVSSIGDVETLRMLNEEFSSDHTIARIYAKALSKNAADHQYREQLEALIKKYNFKRDDFIVDAPESIFKDTYSVSALFPFIVNTLEPNTVPKRNQVVLDLYEGMKQAIDTLSRQGVNISLRAYDTQRKPEKIKHLLETDEIKATDLIVGPFFTDENKPIQDFSLTNRINLFNPFSNNFELVSTNDFGFLFQPSYETLGRNSAEFLGKYLKQRKNCMVFYGNSKKDSVQAAAFIGKAKEAGLSIVYAQEVSRESSRKLIDMLATPTEFDEFKYPIQFTLKKDSIGAIYVASDDALIYTKVISAIDTRADSVVLLGSEIWIEDNAVDFEKYQSLGVVFAAPNYTAASNGHFKAFVRKFARTHGHMPGNYSKLGYEMMLFLGNSLKRYGVYFQEGLNKEKFIKGYLTEGYDYQLSRDNQHVPFIRFIGGQLLSIRNK